MQNPAWQAGGRHGFNRLGDSASWKIVGYIWAGFINGWMLLCLYSLSFSSAPFTVSEVWFFWLLGLRLSRLMMDDASSFSLPSQGFRHVDGCIIKMALRLYHSPALRWRLWQAIFKKVDKSFLKATIALKRGHKLIVSLHQVVWVWQMPEIVKANKLTGEGRLAAGNLLSFSLLFFTSYINQCSRIHMKSPFRYSQSIQGLWPLALQQCSDDTVAPL